MNPTASVFSLAIALHLTLPSGAQDSSPPPEEESQQITDALKLLPTLVASEQSHGRVGLYGVPRVPNDLILDLGRRCTPDEVVLFPARISTEIGGGEGSSGFPPELSIEVADEATFARPIRLARWREDSPASGTRIPFLRIAGNGASCRYVRVSVIGSRPRHTGRGHFFTLGEIVVLEKNVNLALHRPVTTTGSIENAPRWQASNLTDGYLWCLPFTGAGESPSNGYHSLIEKAGGDTSKWVEVDLGEDRRIDEIHLVPAHPRDFADTAGFGFPPRFRLSARNEKGISSLIFDTGKVPFPNPGAAAVIIPGTDAALRHLRIETMELWRRTDDYIFALAELQVSSDGKNIALGKPVTAADSTATGFWSTAALTDGYSSRYELLSWITWMDAISERERLQTRFAELSTIIAASREESLRRWFYGTATLVVLLGLGAVIIVMVQHRRSTIAKDELKRRIAGDLHDELGASLSHLALQSDLARSRIAADDPVAARLASLSHAARETIDNMRDIVWLLAPVTGSWSNLVTRMESISGRLLDGLNHEFSSEGHPPSGSPPIEWSREIVLFLKEALTNAQKHARSSAVSVKLIWHPQSLTLMIEDDGSGFDPASPQSGRGLLNFESRAKALHGVVKVVSSPGSGTRIVLEIPLS